MAGWVFRLESAVLLSWLRQREVQGLVNVHVSGSKDHFLKRLGLKREAYFILTHLLLHQLDLNDQIKGLEHLNARFYELVILLNQGFLVISRWLITITWPNKIKSRIYDTCSNGFELGAQRFTRVDFLDELIEAWLTYPLESWFPRA